MAQKKVETEGHFLFEKDQLGYFQFGFVQGQIDYRIVKLGGICPYSKEYGSIDEQKKQLI